MLKVLLDLFKTKNMASIYADCQNTDRFHFGTVIGIDEKHIAIHMISPDGEDDGIIVIDAENVVRVEIDGQYSEKMKKLCFNQPHLSFQIDMKDHDIVIATLNRALKNNNVVSIELLDSGNNDIVGFVKNISDRECCVDQIDEYGYEDGMSHISTNDITMIRLLSQDEKRIQKLWECNK